MTSVGHTAWQAVTYGGKPIAAFYSSSSGGHTESNEAVWGGAPLPYLRGRCDPGDYTPANPNRIWTVQMNGVGVGNGVSAYTGVNIGIDRTAGFISPLHTHDQSGVIHVESATTRAFSLGQFFDVWGVRFTRECLGGLCDTGSESLRVFVDGHDATGDPRRLELFAHEEIVVAFGTAAELPSPIPRSYGFRLLE